MPALECRLHDVVLLPQPRRIAPAGGRVDASAPVTERTDPALGPEAYRLDLAPGRIEIAAGGPPGFTHARRTLAQLRRVCGETLPCGLIEDAPAFPVRGAMLDISRDKVPTLATLLALIERLAEWKYNRLELYTEHTFAYRNHRTVWEHASPLTADEVRALDAFCRERHLELVPNQNTFGHMERWLRHPAYRDLAECPDGYVAWGRRYDGPFGLNPLDPRSLALVEELLAELLPNFASRQVNIGGDETVDLGQGRSRDACAARGKGRVYLEYLRKIHAAVRRHGRTMNFWGDVILNHPELIPELPRDAVALVWGYEATHPFDEQCARFSASGLPFLVCPGTSTWNSVGGRSDTMLANIRGAAAAGLRHGAAGLLVTEWGDRGHWQPLPVSYPGLAWAAQCAWNPAGADEARLTAQLDRHVYRDGAGAAGALALELGRVHEATGFVPENSSALFWPLFEAAPRPAMLEPVKPGGFAAAAERIRSWQAGLAAIRLPDPEGSLVRKEWQMAGDLLLLACARGARLRGEPAVAAGLAWADLLERFRETWLARNRPGGLADSMVPLLQRSRE
jgi:hypothetical protein